MFISARWLGMLCSSRPGRHRLGGSCRLSLVGPGLRPEHQRALDRLNEVFAGKIDFYGVDVVVFRQCLSWRMGR